MTENGEADVFEFHGMTHREIAEKIARESDIMLIAYQNPDGESFGTRILEPGEITHRESVEFALNATELFAGKHLELLDKYAQDGEIDYTSGLKTGTGPDTDPRGFQ